MGAIDFNTLELGWKPNQFLVVPNDYDTAAKPHAHANDYPVELSDLESAFRAVVAKQPRVTLEREDRANHQVEFVQRSALFRFPDTITVQFLERGEGRSSLAIYSRSTYGIGDMGVNKKRVLAWLKQLDQAVKPV